MRIRYSIVIPVGIVVFCIVFVTVLLMALSNQRMRAEKRNRDSAVLENISTELRNSVKYLHSIQNALRDNDLQQAINSYEQLNRAVISMQSLQEGLSDDVSEHWKKLLMSFIRQALSLGDVIKKGDIVQARKDCQNLVTHSLVNGI